MLLFLAFIVAMSITAALIPLLARLAPAMGLTDRPGPRKVHSQPVPRVGGIAMALGILAPALLFINGTPALRGLLIGVLILLVVGVWDDRHELGYRPKFLGQILAVTLCIGVGGVHFQTFSYPGGQIVLPHLLSLALTFVFLLGVTNAVNLSDGLDGLAGGMALLCFCGVALFAAAAADTSLMALALIEAGALLGFLRFNTHPARIFMGDGGSQVLGFTIGVLAILATQSHAEIDSPALVLLLVGMPIIDTLTVMLHRLRQGRSPFTSDRNHLHHRLLARGFSHGEAVIILYLLQVALFLLAYFLRFETDLGILATFSLFAAVLLSVMHYGARTGWRMHGADGPAQPGMAAPGVRPAWQASLRRTNDAALWIMGACVLVYAVTVTAASEHVSVDVTVLCLLLLPPVLITALWPKSGPAGWLERTAVYMSVVLLVYLDQTAVRSLPGAVSWGLLALTAAAAAVRFCLSPARRFQLTSLDVLVAFIALVIPNLPDDSVTLPVALTGGIAKAVILLYVMEMLLALDIRRLAPRTCLALVLAVLAARGLAPLVA